MGRRHFLQAPPRFASYKIMMEYSEVSDEDESGSNRAVTDGKANPHPPLSVRAFVVIMALLMASNALATDIMLPAFPNIAESLGVETTAVQAVITSYLIGFGLSQLFIGFLADRYGRKPVLVVGIAIYAIAGVASAMAPTLESLLLMRFLQGVGAGAPRVAVGACIRDCYSGRRLAKVMSFVMTLFLVIPLVAPAIGQGILLATNWHMVMLSLGLYGAILLICCWLWLPETLAPENKRLIQPAVISEALLALARSRQTVGYTIASGLFFGSLFGFIATSQQLIGGHYAMGTMFPYVFAAMVASLSIATFINAQLVERLGMRLLSHLAVTCFTVVMGTQLFLSLTGLLSFWSFFVMMTVGMLFVGLVFPNFNALAMEPQGRIAGVASSFVSAITVLLGALIGYFIGQAYNDTATPISAGYTLSGVSTILVLLWTERGRLYQATSRG